MGINTLTPRYLNLDNDSRISAAQEMIDALNVRVSADDDGNQGVIKNIKGNSNIGNNLGYSFTGSTNTIVGCYEHEATNRFFVFVHGSVGTHTVYELNQSDSSFTKIIESANIVLTTTDALHIDGMIIDGSLHLYFTNGVDEPQKINVDTASSVGTYPASQTEANVMKVAPYAPQVNITTDSTRKSNELYGKAFQFAMQWVYRDGEVSAIGEYSSPVAGINTLDNLSDSLAYKRTDNKITLTTPYGTLGLGLGSTIPLVRIYYKKPEDNTMYYIGEYEPSELVTGIDFYNDKSYALVSDSEYNKTVDNVPKSAKAQVIAANRLFYANYKEGFDKADVSATLAVVYEEEAVNTDLPIEITRTGISADNIGILIDTTSVDTLVDGNSIPTTIDFTFGQIVVHDLNQRAITFFKADGTTVEQSFSASDNDYIRLFINNKKYVKSASVAATTYAEYNTNLAAALDGDTFQIDINTGRAKYDNGSALTTYDKWAASFSDGTISFSVSAVATSTGVDVSIIPTSYSVSGNRAWKSDSFLPTKAKNYVSSLSGTFGSTDTSADRWMSTLIGDSFSTVSSGSAQNRTFKSGESHSIGVVFEDSLGRTSGVYELGSAYVERKSDRQNKGTASIDVVLSATNLDSDFVRYFYVYSGGNNISDYVQYSVPNAFAKDSNKTTEPTSNEVIYVSLKALQGTDQSYNNTNDVRYSYSEGDKLRVISYIDDENREYPSDYEFDVIGIETIETDVFVGVSTYEEEIHSGEFLKLKANLSATNFAYTDVFAGNSDWDKNVVVEIYSPSKESDVKIYHAIEGKYDISGVFGVLGQTQTLTEGNAWYKKRALKIGVGSILSPFTQEIFNIESSQYFDGDDSTKGQLGGKPYAVIPNEKEYERISSLTYSEPQAADASQLFLSSFNASLANFFDYELGYGGIFGLCDLSDSIMMLQSDKVSRIPVGRNILTTGANNFVTQTTDVLGLQQHYPIEAGINEDRTAFIKSNGGVYFVDVTRGKIVYLGSQGVKILSDMNISSWVEERSKEMLEASSYSIAIGEDKKNSEVVFTLQDSSHAYNKSIVYSSSLDKFTSFVNYSSDFFGSLGNRFLQIRDNDVYEAEKNSTHSNFFGTQYSSKVKAVFNENPVSRKVFNAIGVDGTANPSATLSTIDQSVSLTEGAFKLKEGIYYANTPRSEGTSQFVMLGAVRSESDPEITFEAKVNRLPFRLGGDVFKLDGGVMTAIAGVTVNSVVSPRVVSMSNAGSVSAGDVIGVKGASVDGDPLRGAYAEVELTFNNTDSFELFSVSAHTSDSGLSNNPQTQQ